MLPDLQNHLGRSMKINEIAHAEQLSEGILDKVKSFASGLTGGSNPVNKMDSLTQQIFLKDFYSDALISLNTAIKSGLVDPSLKTPPSTSVQDPSKVAAPGASFTGSGTPAQKQSITALNDYIKKTSAAINAETDKSEKYKLVKELVNFMADRKGTPEWNNALGTARQVVKRSGVNQFNKADDSLRAGKTMAESWKVYAINQILEAVDVTWEDLGLIVIKEQNELFIAESKYAKMNMVFESIMEASDKETIASFMRDWFNQYMTGVNWSTRKDAVNKYIDNVEKTYKTDGGKEAIKQLGLVAYAISKAGSSTPMGARNAQQAAAPMPQTPSAQSLIAQAQELKRQSPREYEKAMQALPKQ